MSDQHKLMTGAEFSLALVQAEANYADVSRFVMSERRTGHRWEKDGPSNPMARCLQLMHALGLTLEQAEWLINEGVARTGKKKGSLPKPVINLGERVRDMMRAAEEGHHDEDQRDRPARRPARKSHEAHAPV